MPIHIRQGVLIHKRSDIFLMDAFQDYFYCIKHNYHLIHFLLYFQEYDLDHVFFKTLEFL